MVQISKTEVGEIGGQAIFFFRIENSEGNAVVLSNYGASLVAVYVPGKKGKPENVVLGFTNLEGYLEDSCYLGSTVGRFANRIGGAAFELDEKTYSLDKNDGLHSNHGGFEGFHQRIFKTDVSDNTIVFSLESNDGEGGFPGKLSLEVSYFWNDQQELKINYRAFSDQPTVVNFTNHAYFCLAEKSVDALEQTLEIASSKIVECDEQFIPTGKLAEVGALSFSKNRIQEKMNWEAAAFKGINTYYIFDERGIEKANCRLACAESGRVLEVFTTYPGVQFYTGDYLSSRGISANGRKIEPYHGVCLECQYYPDSPNHTTFPSTRLNPGEYYDETIIYKFGLLT